MSIYVGSLEDMRKKAVEVLRELADAIASTELDVVMLEAYPEFFTFSRRHPFTRVTVQTKPRVIRHGRGVDNGEPVE